MNKNLQGKLFYHNISANFVFSEAIDELGVDLKVPLRIKLKIFSFLNKNPTETNQIVIEVIFS